MRGRRRGVFHRDSGVKWGRVVKTGPNKEARVSSRWYTSRCANLRSKYGITYDEVLNMLGEQGGVCPICLKRLAMRGVPRTNIACVDHCHRGGYVRGILCTACNVGIGKLGDRAVLLRSAANYLERAERDEAERVAESWKNPRKHHG